MRGFDPVIRVLVLLMVTSSVAAAEPGFAENRVLINAFCVKCHGAQVQKGGVNLASFQDEAAMLRQRKLWRKVAEQVESGVMPPEGEKQPIKAQREQLTRWLKSTLNAADLRDRDRPDPGRSVIRRLNRSEYNRTIRDLTGVDFDVAGAVGMPDETVGESFDNLATALQFSDSQMEKFFAAAEFVLEKLYVPGKGKGPKGKTPLSPALERILNQPSGETLSPRQVLERFLPRAYRRPIEPAEIDRLLKLFDQASIASPAREDAMRPVLKAILVSPNFLLRIERDRAKKSDEAYRLSDHELAARLSYFLWSSMPDAELTALAEKGELAKPEVIEKQVRRMLADPKARALTDNFAAQWLRLRKIADARPAVEFFPTFNPRLRQAMNDETALFFDKIREEDRSLLELLDSTYTYVNADLAKHYGIANVTGPEFRKVELTDGQRGGLLGMAGILALTSHTSRTSPTLRGKYVLDVVLGTPPPPPPPNVSQIDEAKQKGKSAKNFREQLALHANQATCANCHVKIDPLGFGLENYDAIGRWRPASADIDAHGKLPTGESFNGPKELKQILLERKGRFIENLSEKLFVYALGRETQASDEAGIKAIAADVEKDQYRLSRLVLGIVKSYPFQHRRNLQADEIDSPPMNE